MARVNLPHYRADPATPVRGSPSPRYPQLRKESGQNGAVVLSFIITKTGRPAFRSVVVERATDSLFENAVLANLGSMRFNPASIGGCPVPMLVQQPFEFIVSGGMGISDADLLFYRPP